MLLLLACAPDPAIRTAAPSAPDRRGVGMDAVSETASTTLTGAEVDDMYAAAVAGAGDVDGDGYDDVLVGAYNNSPSSKLTEAGAAYVYLGASSGVSATAACTLVGGASDERFGVNVAGVGDLDDDGYDDIAVGATGYETGGIMPGAVFVYRGSPAGIGAVEDQLLTGAADADYFGVGLAGGDLNGDGFSDLVVGADCAGGGACGGEVYAFHGSGTGVDTTPEVLYTGTTDREVAGWDVASGDDVNADGYDDVLIGAGLAPVGAYTDAGAAYLLFGSNSGTSMVSSVYGTATYTELGLSVTLPGDLDGDGFGDVVAGAIGDNTWSGTSFEGEAWVWYGTASGIGSTPDLVLRGVAAGDRFGDQVAGAGDTNADGFADLLVTAPLVNLDSGEKNAGAAYLFAGSASGLDTTAVDTLYGTAAGSSMGSSAAGAGDVNGDGFSDVVVGADGDDNYTSLGLVGEAYVYLGYDDVFTDEDGDGVEVAVDCDDHDATMLERETAYADTDGDGFGDPALIVMDCWGTPGLVDNAGDCDDTDATVNPAGTEVCGGGDEDCDGLVDDADVVTPTESWFADADGDGFGGGAGVLACAPPAGFVATDTDCDDADAAVNPGAEEVCGGGDEDCDGLVDDADTVSILPGWYTDADGDGYGTGSTIRACVAPAGTAASPGDCDDTNAAANPGAREVCGGGDEDCDGLVDDADPSTEVGSMATVYEDRDGDGFGDPRAAVTACSVFPADAVRDATDCDGTDASAYPGGTEVCGGGDEDCDGVVDEDCEDTGVDTAVDTAVDSEVDSDPDSEVDSGGETAVDSDVDSGPDSGADSATDTAADSGAADDTGKPPAAEGCGCASTPRPTLLALLPLLLARRRIR